MKKERVISFAKNIATMLAFLFIFSLIMHFLSYMFIPKKNQMETSYRPTVATGFVKEPANSLDVMVFGHSSVYSGISPMEFWQDYGFTSYVSGETLASLRKVERNLNLALKTQKPKVVVLEVDPVFYKGKSKSDQRSKKRYLKRFKDSALTYDDNESNSAWLYGIGGAFPFITYHKRWLEINKSDFTNFDKVGQFLGRGYSISTKIKPNKKGFTYMTENKDFSVIPENRIKILENIIQKCKDNDIELLLVSVPQASTWSNKRHDAIEKFANERHLTYIDYNVIGPEIGFNWETDTRDGGDHLNSYGAEKISAHLGKVLHDNYDLPDHRNDSAYAIWDKDFKIYEADRQQLFAKAQDKKPDDLEKIKMQAKESAKHFTYH